MKKYMIGWILFCCISLMSCGQSGRLYLPAEPLKSSSEAPE
ncbi:MAG: hypothetical protein ACD_60C00026G0006 [uncultured bacterium]|nr:MAG: hypothetical protein ACD_60C00026G0006 [uncultured bacterium]